MDIFSKNEENKDIFFKNGEKIRDWGYVDPPLVAPSKVRMISVVPRPTTIYRPGHEVQNVLFSQQRSFYPGS